MKIYTEEEVEIFIKDTIQCCLKGFSNWLSSDNVIVVNKKTNKKVNGVSVNICDNPQSPTRDFIYPLLAEKGIKFIIKDEIKKEQKVKFLNKVLK